MMRLKLQNSLFLLPLLLMGCVDEQVPPPQENVNQQSQEKTAPVHFELKDDSSNSFTMNTQEPEGLTEEFKQQLLGAEEAERLAESEKQNSEDVLTSPPISDELSQVNVLPETSVNRLLSNPGSENIEESSKSDIFDYPPATVQYSEVPVAFASDSIKEWVKEREAESGAYAQEEGKVLYLLVAAGERPHTGFKLLVNGVYEKESDVEFHFELEEVKSGALNIPSKPFILVSIPLTEKNIQFYGDL